VILGHFAMALMEVRQSQLVIGAIALCLASLTAQVANAAGPLMLFNLLAIRPAKMEYMDTAPAFLLPLNFFKLPFMVGLGNITPDSLVTNFKLPAALPRGARPRRRLLSVLDQRGYEGTVLALTLVAGAALFS
jgi:hypothetical protein